MNPWEGAKCFADFCCTDVLRFPAKGVTEAVHEEPTAISVAAQCVASAVIEVAFLEDIALEAFLCGIGVVPVADKSLLAWHLDENLTSLLIGLSFAEAGLGITEEISCHDIDLDGDVGIVGAPAIDDTLVAD